jgi:hypothetical protein
MEHRRFKTLHYFNASYYADGWKPNFDPPGCDMTTDKKALPLCDCVIFHIPSLSRDDTQQLPALRNVVPRRQIWIFESEESTAHFPILEEPGFQQLFDYEMTYRRSADIWTPYIPSDFDAACQLDVDLERRETCCAFISSSLDRAGRRAYMRELSQHMQIDSFGRFMNNKQLPNDAGIASKLQALKKYRFTLSFENSTAEDYVTEKFFEPLTVGTIPVYLGAPNIEVFAPGNDCYINASEFKDPGELAEFLRNIDPNEYLAWRNNPLRPSFRSLLDQVRSTKQHRLSDVLHHHFAPTGPASHAE